MKFKELLNRLTGISVPIFGVSWNPPEIEITKAKRIITFLEDRRVLYDPSEVEVPRYCVDSVNEIRRFLTAELGDLNFEDELSKSLRAMRAACRKFLERVGEEDGDIIRFGAQEKHYASWIFISALGELRGVFGIHIAKIAAEYGLNVEDSLAAILPAADDENKKLKVKKHKPLR